MQRGNSMDGYYEYYVMSLVDEDGRVNVNRLNNRLNQLGKENWRLKCVTTNELGKNIKSGGLGGFSKGTNETINETILIFERFVDEGFSNDDMLPAFD